MNTHPPRPGALTRSRRTSLIAALGLSTSLLAAVPAAADPAPTPSASTAPAPAADPLASLKAEAKKQNKRIEIESYRTDTSTTYANPDGKTLYAEVHSTPIRVEKDGAWQPIDTRLVEQDGVIKPKAIKGDLTLSTGGDSTVVKIKNEKGTAEVAATGKLPKPRLVDNTATYPSAYGKGIDLVVTVTPTGFRQDVVIRERPAGKLKIRVPVDLPKGVRYGKDASGDLSLLADKGGKELVDITTAQMMDAAAVADPEKGRLGTAAMTAKQTATGQELVISPDTGFLADPAVTYPVTMAAASDTWTGTGIADDTFVSHSYPSSSGNMTLDRLIAGKSNSGSVTWRSYIRFNVDDTPLMGGTVENADLRLWNYQSNTCDSEINSGIIARPVITDWNASTMTWNNQPAVTGQAFAASKGAYDIDCARGEGELYYSIEEMVQGWMDGANDYGVRLSAVAESDLTNWRWYRSSEYGYWGNGDYPRGPVLFVQYVPAPEPVFVAFPSNGDPSDRYLSYDEAMARKGAITSTSSPPVIPGLTREEAEEIARASDVTYGVNSNDITPPEWATPEDIAAATNPDGPPGETTENDDPAPTLPGDTQPPSVVAIAPPAGATAVAPEAWLTVDFNEQITGGVVTLRDSDGAVVEGELDTPEPDDDPFVMFTPNSKLKLSTTYTAQISGAKDLSGNVMADFSWTFTISDTPTPAPSPSTAPPVVTETFPTQNTNDASRDTEVKAHFNKPVIKANIEVKSSSGSSISGTQTMDPDQNVLTFVPASSLEAETQYTATVSAGVDEVGNVMDAYTWSFKTSAIGTSPSPSPSTGEQRTVSLPVQLDGWISREGVTSSFDDSTLWAGVYSGIAERTYLKFDTSALAGKKITSAELEVWNSESYGCGDSTSGIKAQRITTDWNPATLAWSNQPAATDSGEAVSRGPGECSGYVTWTWPMTEVAQAWAAGQGNYGLMLRGVDESASSPQYDRGYRASEDQGSDGHPPVLKVTYTDTPGSTPTATPTTGPDTAPPTILKVEPVDGTEDAPADAQVKVTFSEPVTDARLSLTDIFEETEVPGSTTMDAGNTVLTFTPSQPLDFFYWAEVSGAKDAAGNVMDDSYGWSFSIEQQIPTEPSACRTASAWTSGGSYPVGTQVKHRGHAWESIPLDRFQLRQEPGTGNGWGWRDLGACTSAFSSSTSEKQAGPESPMAEARNTKPSVDKVWTRSLGAKDGTAVVPTTTPELMVKVSDPLKRKSTVEVEVTHDPKAVSQDKKPIWSGIAKGVASGSAVAIRVPAGKVKDGSTVHWRARARNDSSTGTWSSWQPLEVSSSTATATAAQSITTSSSSNNFRWFWAECQEEPRSSFGVQDTGALKNRFSSCYHSTFFINQYNLPNRATPVGGVNWRYTVLGETNQNSRDLLFQMYVDEWEPWGERNLTARFWSQPVTIALGLTNDPLEDGKCNAVKTSGADKITRTLRQWVDGRGEAGPHGHYNSPSSDPIDGNEQRNYCQATFWFESPWTEGKLTTSDSIQQIRCDTAKYINLNPKGGCIFVWAKPHVTIVEDYGHQAFHLWYAKNQMEHTIPRKERKSIPGFSIDSTITRITSKTKRESNHKRSQRTCKRVWGKNYADGYAVTHNGEKGNCDEFPFQSTREGSADRDPRTNKFTDNFSVLIIGEETNQGFGRDILNIWYNSDRILDGDTFWVRLK
ncbi:Ig-like domain-containing protein [Planomonospora sp. ID91781]|uniref:DNRLRE domain-containing protein n=1 Tax=Planomonospora sp. ID91781 TaxID=2738135 RepID=UPI0018C434A1|nr:DNRLRE domain-containing protein [Planomonospora sp. ID91781]MBG0824928.1 Ig-like domain-containing protein [Planomonospora sp. ID91781]